MATFPPTCDILEPSCHVRACADLTSSARCSEFVANSSKGELDGEEGFEIERQALEDERQDLSKDLLLILFNELNVQELALVLLVSTAWRRAALDPVLHAWSSLSGDTFRGVCLNAKDAPDNQSQDGHRGQSVTIARSARGSRSAPVVIRQQLCAARWKPPSLLSGEAGYFGW